MFKLLKGGRVFSPDEQGRHDILLCGEIIAAMNPSIEAPRGIQADVYDLDGACILPGFIDQHVHLIGGGGEAGFATRTPEVTLSGVTRWGITTVVGCLGTDGVTRHLAGLLAKARGLECEGISAYMYSGSYQVPPVTLTGSIRSDIVLIDKVIGAGEIAISDHRSSQPSVQQLKALAAESRTGGMLSGKAGIVNVHVGSGRRTLEPLIEIVETSEIPISQFMPTHVNRCAPLLDSAIGWGRRGGYLDVTTGVSPDEGFGEAIKPSTALRDIFEAGVAPELVTMSSDGNGSMPVFDERGNLQRLLVAPLKSLYLEFVDSVTREGIPLGLAASVITSNVAKALRLYPRKGCVAPGSDADLVVLDSGLRIAQVWARGRLMVMDGECVVKGTFE
ncbi:MAG: beta-aspartyl-peptidase [Firmicutes bacterium]|nr:beta-aspartyl-peptidase [Bacillota bacterium]